jgi:spermidine synthase
MKVLSLLRLIVLALVAGVPVGLQAQELIHSEKSLYRQVLVYEDSATRCMCFTVRCSTGRQTCIYPKNVDHLALGYSESMLASLYIEPRPKSILIIGLGGGVLPRTLAKLVPGVKIDVVEIDPAVTRVAEKYFEFKQGPDIKVTEMDGRVFVKRAGREKKTYDMIMLDAFDHEYIPEHLLTQEFLEEVKQLMHPGSLLVANTFSSSGLYDSESVTYQKVFGEFYNLKTANRVIIARSGPLPTVAEITKNAGQFEDKLAQFRMSADDVLPLFTKRVDWDTQARVLTDQYSPANLLNSR